MRVCVCVLKCCHYTAEKMATGHSGLFSAVLDDDADTGGISVWQR